jgi:PAS domain S-box-containing protein
MALNGQDPAWKVDLPPRQQARESEERYRLLFEKMLNGFVLYDIVYDEKGQPYDYRLIEVNPAFEELTGLRASDVAGNLLFQSLPGLESFWIDGFNQVASTGEPARLENYIHDLKKIFRRYGVQTQKRAVGGFLLRRHQTPAGGRGAAPARRGAGGAAGHHP